MNSVATRTTLIRHELQMRTLKVLSVSRITPRMVRITLGGSELDGFTTLSPDDHVKLFFPPTREEKPAIPTVGANGIEWPDDKPLPVGRDYTPRRYDAEAGTLDVDFYLHGTGVAADWAANAQPGQYLGVAGPRGSRVVDYDFDWYLLMGDESALPAIARRLEELPPDADVYVFMNVANVAEMQELEAPANSKISWLFRDSNQHDKNPLKTALHQLEFPSGECYAWIAGEAGNVRAVYQYLLEEKAMDRQNIKANGYWKNGVSNHNHHEPIEN
jgi:NADPH-dependent ferric siderophore reductase